MNGTDYLSDAIVRFRDTKWQCEQAFAQVPEGLWSRRLDPGSNSLATLCLHISGNMLSRWTDFLISDGEKPDRDRDAEFEDPESLSHDALLERWSHGWAVLFETVSGLTESDLDRTVTIRGQPLTVVQAINRQVAHYAYHAGQIVFLSKHLATEPWQTLSITRKVGGHSK